MARFHIGKSGKSAACNAKVGNCPLGSDSEHFKTREEANQAAEKKMGAEFKPTASKSKSSGGKSKAKPSFSIPEGVRGEGYMGGGSWTGGNLIRMQEEREKSGKNGYIDNKEIATEIRSDIKKAVQSGYLPSRIDGYPLKYSVATDGGRGMRITARSEGLTSLDLNSVNGDVNGREWDRGNFVRLNNHTTETAELEKKLENLQDSYRYNGSNSMVDYFDSNFYGTVKVEGNGDFASLDKSEKKLNRLLMDSVKNGEVKINSSDSIENSDDTVNNAINEAINKNPKVRQALIEYKAAHEHYEAQRKVEKSTYEINKDIEREVLVQGGSDPSMARIDSAVKQVEKERAETNQQAKDSVKYVTETLNEKSKLSDVFPSNTREHTAVGNRFYASLERAGNVRPRPRRRRFY